MIRKIFSIVLIVSCFSLVGCDRSRVADTSAQEEPIKAPGIEQVQSLSQKADVFYQTRDYGQSATFYEEVIQLDPKNLKAHYRLGNIAFRGQDWRKARAQYEKVVEIEPRHTRAQYNLAMTYLTLAERHLKFYAANVDANANLEAVTKLVTALEEISNTNSESSRSQKPDKASDETPLDSLLEALSQ